MAAKTKKFYAKPAIASGLASGKVVAGEFFVFHEEPSINGFPGISCVHDGEEYRASRRQHSVRRDLRGLVPLPTNATRLMKALAAAV